MANSSYQIALAALQFFSLPAAQQIESARLSTTGREPVFFDSKSDQDAHSDYFKGVACVFKTYQGYLLEDHVAEDALGGFVHRLNVEMHNRQSASEWSERAVTESDMWARLRADARRALDEFGDAPTQTVPQFDLEALIDPSEFLTSEGALRLLGP